MWISRKKYEELISEKSKLVEDRRKDINDLTKALLDKNAFCQRLNSWCMGKRTEITELNNRIKELEAQLSEKESDTKLPFVVIHCTAQSKWDDVIKDPKNKNKTTTEKEYLKNNCWILSKKDRDFIDNFHSVVLHCTVKEEEEEKEQPKEKEVEVKPYYFETEPMLDALLCSEICNIVNIENTGIVMIGSNYCKTICSKCVGSGECFIKCKLKPEGKAKKTERFKRDEYGVISESETPCNCCIYNKLPAQKECLHCTLNNKDTEYYSSK